MKAAANLSMYLAEMFGTFCLVLVGIISIVLNNAYAGLPGNLGISIAFGLIVLLMVVVFGKI